jgi:two-component system phosphate regulon sensor histidine kinase PhoR
MRREFTANVSHELKTPLHTISGCAELMANGVVKPEDMNRFSTQIYSEAQRMVRLVDDIIRLSHLDEGADDLKREEVDLYALAEQTVGSLLPVANEAQVKLTLEGETAVMNGIPQLLQGILYNLCDNGIKYNRPGGAVAVTVQNEGQSVRLTVADTGIGIPAEHQERIFERFYRVDKSHSKEIGGTGLGLSIVKHAARLHNASIELQSEPGRGTTITVTFPAKYDYVE